ncbi:MAG: hypothetical protein JNN30_00685, partial [Rhodanobacteraceae bacterium]|nr:hypothetical protein [Rhodanobacteraceae bacterium]
MTRFPTANWSISWSFFLFRAVVTWIAVVVAQPVSAQSCPALGTCPANAECVAATPAPWGYGCSYHNGAPPGGDDAACKSITGYPWPTEGEMEGKHAQDLAEAFCQHNFALVGSWIPRINPPPSDPVPSCLAGFVLAETRIYGDQCPDDPQINVLCYYARPHSTTPCEETPAALAYVNEWARARTVVCPSGSQLQGNVCVKAGVDERKPDSCDALTGHPVNALSGNKRLVETDWTDPSASGLLTFRRTYASFSAPDSLVRWWPVGRAWRHNFDLSLIDAYDGVRRLVTVFRADGHLTQFSSFVGNEAHRRDERMTLTLVSPPVSGVSYRLRNADDSIESYDADGLLVSIERANTGSGITLQRDALKRITQVRDTLGRELAFSYVSANSRQIALVTLPDSYEITYTYSGEELQSVVYPDLTTRSYEYYSSPQAYPGETLLKRVFHNGVEYTFYEYAQTVSFGGRLRHLATKSRLSGANADYQFSYSLNPSQAYSSTTVTAPLGATDTLHSIVRDGRLLVAERSQTCASCGSSGSTRNTAYDSSGLPMSSADFRGTIDERQHDARGRETLRREAGRASSNANGCPVGTSFTSASPDPGCSAGACLSTAPFPGARHAERFGLPNQFLACASQAAASPALRTTSTIWHPTLNIPTERIITNASNQTESIVRWEYNTRGQVTARCEIDPSDPAALAYACSAQTPPLTTARVRRWVHAYCEAADVTAVNSTCPYLGLAKSVNGPRSSSDAGMNGADDITTFTYYASTDESGCGTVAGPCRRKGDLWKTTNALGQVSEVLSYDRGGRAVLTRDPNGTLRGRVYNARGWMTSTRIYANTTPTTSANDAVTFFAHDAVGNITLLTQPDGVALQYRYDAAHRLTDVIDAAGNRIRYTLDAAGNRLKEETFDATYNPGLPGQGLKRSLAQQYNTLSRLVRELNASNLPTRDSTPYDSGGLADGFDANGNAVWFKDGFDIQTQQTFDPLNRLAKVVQDYNGTDPETANATTEYTYDARNNLRVVKDPDGLSTNYTYGGLNDLTGLDSPDTGHTDYAYDLAGNRIGQTDNRGVTSTYTYDAVNRLRAIAYPTASLNVAFHYDENNATTGCANSYPIGRLTRMTDSSGTTTYCYDRRGNVLVKQQVTSGNALTVAYTYTLADRIATVTYPSGGIAAYVYDSVGRTSALTWKVNAGAVPVTIVSSVSYYPFGPANVLSFGNGRSLTKTYDNDYVIDSIASSATDGLKLDFGRDVMANLTSASSTLGASPPERRYVYDRLYRLSEVNDSAGTMLEDYDYNKTGDRTFKQFAGQAGQLYSYTGGSHRLGSVAGVARSYDANGNTTNRGDGMVLGYDASNRLASAAVPNNATTYAYSGRGERTLKNQANGGDTITNRYIYNESGQMLADRRMQATGIRGGALTEYLFLDAVPVAISRVGGLSYIEADHLGTPRVAFNPATNTKEW